LAGNPTLRVAMGQAGRARVEELFDETIVIRKTLGVYARVLPQWQDLRQRSGDRADFPMIASGEHV